jgi:6,7-dimethyl-8-ribityllumazine synthase
MAKVHIIVSEFNQPIPDGLLKGALKAFSEAKFPQKEIEVSYVPGAFELPLAAKKKATEAQTKLVICLGAVINGDTDHYQYVCAETARGIMQVTLETMKPVLFGVLTTQTEKHAIDRSLDNQANKGYECGLTALKLLKVK